MGLVDDSASKAMSVLGIKASGVLAKSAEDRRLIADILLKALPAKPKYGKFSTTFANIAVQSSKGVKLPETDFNQLMQLFNRTGIRNDLLFYDDNDIAKQSNNRIGVLAMYSYSTDGLNYDRVFNIRYSDSERGKYNHSVWLIDDYVFDFVLGINGAPLCQYLMNIFTANPHMVLNTWSSCNTPLAKWFTQFALEHSSISYYTLDKYARTVSDKFAEDLHNDLYLENVNMHLSNHTEPLIEYSDLSVKPKPKAKSKPREKSAAEEKKPRKPRSTKTAKSKGTKGSKVKSAADDDSTSDKPVRKSKHTIDGVPREEGVSRKVQREMLEDVRKQLQAAIALCED